MPIVNCKTCGVEFNKLSAQIKEYPQHFCCHKHYAQFITGKEKRPTHAIFLEKVLKTSSGCWEWMGAITMFGYGVFYDFNKNRAVRVHRYSYEHYKDETLGNLTVDHLCRNKKCVNPKHLEAVSLAENIRRSRQPNTFLNTDPTA